MERECDEEHHERNGKLERRVATEHESRKTHGELLGDHDDRPAPVLWLVVLVHARVPVAEREINVCFGLVAAVLRHEKLILEDLHLVLAKLKVDEEHQTGINILKSALEEPVRVIADNSGAEGAVVLAGVLKGTGNHGYDAATDKFGDMLKMGIIDPAKVTRAAVENAVSVGGMILTTESMMSDIQEPAAPAPPMPGGGGMDGMGGMGF